MNINTKSILSLLLLILFVWNLMGWWFYPVTISILNHADEGEACCNGALVCCCKAAGEEECFCSVISDSETPIACGIESPTQPHSDSAISSFTFLEFKAVWFVRQINENPAVFTLSKSVIPFSLLDGFSQLPFRPPIS